VDIQWKFRSLPLRQRSKALPDNAALQRQGKGAWLSMISKQQFHFLGHWR